MGKNVPSKHSRRHSTGNLLLELTGYEDVLSRYLSAPFPSCHDNCKPSGFDHPTQPKSAGHGQRSNKTHVDSISSNSVHGIKKLFTPIPRSPTKHVKKNTNSSPVKHQYKPESIESKLQNLKSKSKVKSKSQETDPFYIPPSRITRRLSDVITPTNNFGDVHDCKKIEPRKELKRVKSSLTTLGNDTISKNVQPFRNSVPTNPIPEVIQEKVKKSQNQDEERVLETGQKKAQFASKSKKDEITQTQSPNNGSLAVSRVKKPENPTRVGKLVKENEDHLPQKLKFKQGKTTDLSESSGSRKLKFQQGKVLDDNKNVQENNKSLRRLSSNGVLHAPETNSVNVALKPCDAEAKKHHMRLNHVIEETASKLIQTRKSKVQALVGAFEMISANEL